MMTQQEMKRIAEKCNGSAVLDPNTKPEVAKKQIADLTDQLFKQVNRLRPGTKISLFWSEMR
jgi:hypothetical protein